MSRIAIVSAMAQELHGLQQGLSGARCVQRAGREFWTGRLGAHDAVLVLSRIGKVAAATTVTLLLAEFDVERVLFTGVAGGLGPARVGDIVVADTLLQHDMDASPLFPRYEVPLYGRSHFAADASLSAALQAAATSALAGLHLEHLADFGIAEPRVRRGLILSGDRFVASAPEAAALQHAFPAALAVEMEGAAVAQVCHDFGVPFAVLRSISDRADDSAHVDFERFIADVASRCTVAILSAFTAT
jgi:adenosylhomocysteine nucleosidase